MNVFALVLCIVSVILWKTPSATLDRLIQKLLWPFQAGARRRAEEARASCARVAVCCRDGNIAEARKILAAMQSLGRSKAQRILRAEAAFYLILAYCNSPRDKVEDLERAYRLFHDFGQDKSILLLRKLRLLRVMAVVRLSSCYGRGGNIGRAQEIFEFIKCQGDLETVPLVLVPTTPGLVYAYVISGDIELARKMFDEMKSFNSAEKVWEQQAAAASALIEAYAKAGELDKAQQMVEAVRNWQGSSEKFQRWHQQVSSVMKAYSPANCMRH
ncbi:hypothetical protein AGMMS50225_00040 [Betaproteobacteria bacterium]|nr:hypothetical protein AGMMS50225_00040 [Betaproteobacteria bacterium]